MSRLRWHSGVEVVEQETQPGQDLAKSRLIDAGSGSSSASRPGEPTAPPRDSAQVKQGAETTPPEAQAPLEKERRRAESPRKDLAKVQQTIETQAAVAARDQAAQLESATAELRQSLQKERERAEALAGDLAKARREVETQWRCRARHATRRRSAIRPPRRRRRSCDSL